jgi:hypothetical protein
MTDRTIPDVRALAEAFARRCRTRPTYGADGAGVVGGEPVGVDP